MKNNKRIPLILVSLALNLAIMACHIPLVSQSVGTGATETQYSKATEFSPTEVVEPENITPTPDQAANTVADGKQVYYSNGVEITLPSTYIVGDSEEIESLLDEGELFNNEHGKSIELIFDNFKDDVLLWGYDTDPKDDGETGLLVLKNEQFGGMSLMLISSFIKPMIGSQLDIIEQGRLTINDRDTLRLMTKSDNRGLEGYQVFYIFNEDGKLWVIGFFTNNDLVQDRLEVYYDAVASFEIVNSE